MPKITAIELENFQTIGERTVIPIRDLTLMFGPNGAGKSSIFDALEFFKILVSDDWGDDCQKLQLLIDKWSRNIDGKSRTKCLGIGIQFYVDDKWSADDLPYIWQSRLDLISHSSMRSDGDHSEDFLNKNYRFFVKFKDIGDGIRDWIISDMSISSDDNMIFEVKAEIEGNFPKIYIHKKEWISFRSLDRLNEVYKKEEYSGPIISRQARNGIGYESTSRSWFYHGYEGYVEIDSEFFKLSQQIIDFFKSIIFNELLEMDLVNASRTVPKINESISIIPGDKGSVNGTPSPGYRLNWSIMLSNLESTINVCENHWTYMCKLVATSLATENDEENNDWFDLSYLGRINSLLREELFIENGYSLSGEVFCISPLEDHKNYSLEDAWFYPKLARLYLKDNYQRKLEINEVGSGIGYVLPVLAALVSDDVALIQQPELHLHPKLQSRLGEAIVRAIENKKYLRAFTIIETHSEHILLKIMRLIKNSKSRAEESINPISFENVCILYFDPLPNGETRVKRLRLGPDGQLIDRWPGGFFDDRIEDIFDE